MNAQQARHIKAGIDALDRARYNLANMCDMPQPNDAAVAQAGNDYVDTSRALQALLDSADVAIPETPGGPRAAAPPLAPGSLGTPAPATPVSGTVAAPEEVQQEIGTEKARRANDRVAPKAEPVPPSTASGAAGKSQAPGQASTAAPGS